MDLKALETFLWVSQLGSFRLAAEKLNMTQPGVSQRISALEKELGRKLLERDSRIVVPTPAGREALLYAEKLLRLRSEFVTALSDKAFVRGLVRVGSSESIAHTWLPTFMKRVNEIYPALSIELEVDSSPNLRGLLMSQSIELAFLIGPITAPAVRNRSLCSYAMSFLASPRLNLANKRLSVVDIARWPIVTFARNTQPYELVRELFSGADAPLVRIHACASLATAIRMTSDGIGVAALPATIVSDLIAGGILQLLETDFCLPPLNFVASWMHSSDSLIPEALAGIGVETALAWNTECALGQRAS